MNHWTCAENRWEALSNDIDNAIHSGRAVLAVVLAYELHQELVKILQEEMQQELEKVIGHADSK